MCTNFLVKTSQECQAGKLGFVNGRSMEFAEDLRSSPIIRGSNYKYEQNLSGREFGYTWIGKYGFVGMNALELPIAIDGINSVGLATGALWLPGTKYQQITDRAKGLSVDYFTEWVLSSFGTCDEVVDALKSDTVQVGFPNLLSTLLPLHFPVHDANGKSIVIEFIDGKIKIHDNPVGVLTNDPPFDWHLQNLRNYVGITPWDAGPVKLGDLAVEQTGHGSGFTLLPGSSTPPSRFVRVTMMSNYSFAVPSLEDATTLAFHILNTVDIPKGTARFHSKVGKILSDYTQWIVVKDLSERIYSFKFYESQQLYTIKLDEIDFRGVDWKLLEIPHQPASINLIADGLTQ
ncbi:MAG: choloylglycine hydrolase family protein [Symploca sp. SIO3C6]|nr:choloylglycine hydrolase family protein [Symploca sp. SIO3C6]